MSMVPCRCGIREPQDLAPGSRINGPHVAKAAACQNRDGDGEQVLVPSRVLSKPTVVSRDLAISKVWGLTLTKHPQFSDGSSCPSCFHHFFFPERKMRK